MAVLNSLVLALYFRARTLGLNVLSSALQHVLAEEVEAQDDNGHELNAVHDDMNGKALGVTRGVVGTEHLGANGVTNSPCANE